MIFYISVEMKRKAKLWRDTELKMLNMRSMEFNLSQIRRWGIKNLNAYNNLNLHIDWLTKIVYGQIQYVKI